MTHRLGRSLTAAALLSATAAAPIVAQSARSDATSHTVKRGDTIVWRNKDPYPHTVTAKGAFDSRSIAAGKEWKFVARTPGVYPYLCTLHPTMTGTLRVQ